MLIVFPIAFWLAALFCDLAYTFGRDSGFAEAAMWLVGAGLLVALFAAVAGLTDFLGDRRIRALGDAWQHMLGNVAAVLVAAVSLAMRLTEGAEAAVLPWGLALAATVALLLAFTGWKGGNLVYRHGIGVHEPGELERAGATEAIRAADGEGEREDEVAGGRWAPRRPDPFDTPSRRP